jgi:hypothetical protein
VRSAAMKSSGPLGCTVADLASRYLDFPELQGILLERPHHATKGLIGRIVIGHEGTSRRVCAGPVTTCAPESRANLDDRVIIDGRRTVVF